MKYILVLTLLILTGCNPPCNKWSPVNGTQKNVGKVISVQYLARSINTVEETIITCERATIELYFIQRIVVGKEVWVANNECGDVVMQQSDSSRTKYTKHIVNRIIE